MKDLIQIIEGSIKLDRLAQEALYIFLKNKLFTVVFRITGDRELANDVLQESFIEIFRSLGALKNKEAIVAWAKRIAIRKSFLLLKKERKMEFDTIDDNIKLIKTEKDSDVEYIEKAIQLLPVKSKAVFVLSEIEGFLHREIAEILNISVGTSKSQLSYAKTKLKKYIDQLN